MDYTGLSRGPPDTGFFPTAVAGPPAAGPGPSTTSYAAPTVGHKAPAKRAAGTGRGRGGGRGRGRGRGALAGLGPTTGRLDAPLASSSVVGQRSTRSANRPRVATLKLKFSDKGEVQKVQGGQLTSFLGNYSREADSDPDEPLVFEEQFILRVPDKVVRGDKEKGIKGIKTLLEEKKEVNNAFFKFKDTRRAVFNHGGTNYSAKLVDLPCIIEAQKTLDRKRLFKVADICQMLVVDPDPIDSEDQVTQDQLDPRDFVWPHGLTPPLRHVRERRWRVRRKGDLIKAEVDRLLAKDKEAKHSSFDLLELDKQLDDEEAYDDENPEGYPYREGTAETELGQETPGTPWSQGEGLEEGSAMGDMDDRTELGSVDGDMDMDLEAALNREEDEGATDEEDEDEEEGDDDDDEAEEEEEDEEIVELRAQQRLLEQEASALEEMVSKKTQEMLNVSAMIRMRIQRDVTKYQADLAAKIKARDENQSKIDAKVEAKDKAREVKETEKEDDYDGLFGDDEEEEEEDGQGEIGDEEDEDDEWDQIFANEEGAATITPGNMGTPRDNDHEMEGSSSIGNRAAISLNSPEHHEHDGEDDEGDEEDEDDDDAEGEDDEHLQDSVDSGAPAPFIPPIAHQQPIQPHAPATGGWGYVESDEDEDDD